VSDILISKRDEVYVQVKCDKGIAASLNEFFTFRVPGYQYTPAYRNKFWDGKVRLFNYQSHLIYSGLVPYIEQFALDRGYTCATPNELLERPFSRLEAQNFVEQLNVPHELRDYQLDAFIHAIQAQKTLLISPTASGKSLIIYLIVRKLLSEGFTKGLLVVPTTSLVEQMVSDFASYGWDTDEFCHKVYSGHDKTTDRALTVSTWQSLFKLPAAFFTGFDFVIGDEAHTFKAKSLTGLMVHLVNARYRVGTTGTLDGTKCHKLVLEGLFGPCKQVTTTKKLMDAGHVSQAEIKCLVLKHPLDICKKLRGSTYQEEISYLINCTARNNFIANLTLSLQGNTLILYRFVESFGIPLTNQIREKCGTTRKIFFVSGDTPAEERDHLRAIVEKENDAIIVASYGTFSTGINIRNLHNIVFANPTKSMITVPQSIGRSLRLGENKERATIFDIVDDLRVKTKENFTLQHFIERLKLYHREKFRYKIYKINLS
jgi:superfamily II DNA or RNA helicase